MYFFRKYRKMKRVGLNKQTRKSFFGSSRGFTLIEVLIAIAILGTIAITFLGALSTSSMAFIVADERATAQSLARSQMEYVKNYVQSHGSTNYSDTTHQGTYPKITGIPLDYSIWSVNSTGQIIDGGSYVIGVPWDSNSSTPADTDTGIQKIALLIKHQGKEIYTFINDNPNWATGVKITLEGYIRKPMT
jgi:prepilin-type N-terminal cleavage/methylation domain-containing protein